MFGDNRQYLVAMLTLDPDESRKLAARLGIPADPATIAADPRRARGDPEGGRRGQREPRADRADQAVRDPRPRPHPGRRRAHPDAQGQARHVYDEVRRRLRRPVRGGGGRREHPVLQRGCRLAAHGPADQPDGDQFGVAVRRAGRLGAGHARSSSGGSSTATHGFASAWSRAGCRCGRRSGRTIRTSRSSITCTTSRSRHPARRRPAGAHRRPDDDAAGPQPAALAHVHDRRLRRRRGDDLPDASLHRRRDRARAGDAVADRRRARRRDRGGSGS